MVCSIHTFLSKKTLLEAQKTKLEILEKENKLRGRNNSSNNLTSSPKSFPIFDSVIVFLLSPFLSKSANNTEYKPLHKILGVVIEFAFLCGFLYTIASSFASYYAVLDSNYIIPVGLQNLTITIIMSSVGGILYLGILFGEILGMTNILGREFEKPKLYLIAVSITIILQIVFSLMVASYRLGVLFPNNQLLSTLKIVALVGQNLSIISLLLSTVFAFRGILALAVLLALVVYIVKILVNGLSMLFGNKKTEKPKQKSRIG